MEEVCHDLRGQARMCHMPLLRTFPWRKLIDIAWYSCSNGGGKGGGRETYRGYIDFAKHYSAKEIVRKNVCGQFYVS